MKQALADAREAMDRGEFTLALELNTRVAQGYPDLALSHRRACARVHPPGVSLSLLRPTRHFPRISRFLLLPEPKQPIDCCSAPQIGCRARMGRIEALFELGEREDAFLELEDELVDVGVGNAQVHAAMAAMLHTQRPQQGLRAESEWEKAVELAPKFADAVRWGLPRPAAPESQQRVSSWLNGAGCVGLLLPDGIRSSDLVRRHLRRSGCGRRTTGRRRSSRRCNPSCHSASSVLRWRTREGEGA